MTTGTRAGRIAPPTWACSDCAFELWVPVAGLRVSHVGLYDDARFPGRCLLALHEHQEDLAELDEELLRAFMADLRDLTRAIKDVTGAKRVNQAVLGNTVAHVHWHVIPRQPSREPLPGQSPWDDPRPRGPLPPGELSILGDLLQSSLASQGHDSARYAAAVRPAAPWRSRRA